MISLTSVIAAGVFYLYPTLIGRAIYSMINLLRKCKILPYPLVSYFVIGAVVHFALILFLNYTFLPFFTPVSFITLLRYTTIILAIFSAIINLCFTPKIQIKNTILPMILVSVLSSVAYFIWQYQSSYSFNWDLYEHQTLVNTILNGRFSFITTHITDTFIFNSYSSIFHTLMATSQLIKTPIVEYWHTISIIHCMIVVAGSYYIAKQVTDNKSVAIICAIIGAFVFESTIAFTAFFFIPQTFTASIFIFLFIQLLSLHKRGELPHLVLVVLYCLFLILSHYIIGTVAVITYVATYLYFRFKPTIHKYISLTTILEIVLFVGIIAVLFSPLVSLGSINHGEGAGFTYSLSEKFTMMRQMYGLSLIIFFLVGVVVILRKKVELGLLHLIIATAFIILVLLQLPYMLKFLVLGRFFINLIMAIGVYRVIVYIQGTFLKTIAWSILIITFIAILIANSLVWKQSLYYRNGITQVSPDEIKAAEFLKTRYGNTDILLISDPATQFILEAFSGVNSPGGAFANSHTRNELASLPKAINSREMAQHLYNINDAIHPTLGKRLFVASGRYFIWQSNSAANKSSINFDVWYPADLTFEDKKNLFSLVNDNNHFHQVYANAALTIFEVSE